jgi:hypothetical protein
METDVPTSIKSAKDDDKMKEPAIMDAPSREIYYLAT